MILGIGTDITRISRIKESIMKFENAFLDKVFTDIEQKEGKQRKSGFIFFAGRWAAKEAFSKAIGTGFGENCQWKDINVINEESGKPSIKLTGLTKSFTKSLGVKNIHVTISHESEYASAFVILEK